MSFYKILTLVLKRKRSRFNKMFQLNFRVVSFYKILTLFILKKKRVALTKVSAILEW